MNDKKKSKWNATVIGYGPQMALQVKLVKKNSNRRGKLCQRKTRRRMTTIWKRTPLKNGTTFLQKSRVAASSFTPFLLLIKIRDISLRSLWDDRKYLTPYFLRALIDRSHFGHLTFRLCDWQENLFNSNYENSPLLVDRDVWNAFI